MYGPIDGASFPAPLPPREAGACANGDRRYLWTDAFAVLALATIADNLDGAPPGSPLGEPARFRCAAGALVNAVHAGLGAPRSPAAADAMRADPRSPTGHVGLRIGKVSSAPRTDVGMALDGQYFHYLDKWLLALVRAGRADDAAAIAKAAFPPFFDAGPHGDGRGGGVRWKLSADASAPLGLAHARATDDTLGARIVLGLVEHHRSRAAPSLRAELALLDAALRGYVPRATDDPLGWGLQAFFDGFVRGQPRARALAALAPRALDARHFALPFRLYGALLGARVALMRPAGAPLARAADVERLMDAGLERERRAAAADGQEHTSINRVMLAACCIATPGAFAPRDGEPLVEF